MFTLDSAESWGIKIAPPNSLQGYETEPHFAAQRNYVVQPPHTINAALNDRGADFQAPGIRDQMQNPSMPYFPPRPSTFASERGVPNFNYDVPFTPVLQPWAHKRSAVLWKITHNNQTETPAFRDVGSYSGSPITMSFRSFRPRSTMYFA